MRLSSPALTPLWLLAGAIWLAVSPSATPAQEPWRATLSGFVDGLVTTGLDQDAVAGAVVVMVSSKQVLISRGYRLSDARTGRQVSPTEDVIPLASISKVFTALAVLRLADEGRLSLGDPLGLVLPELDLDERFGQINIAHLLTHTAGLEERFAGYFAHPAQQDTPSRLAEISAILPRQIRPPEDVVAYSNASYVLLGEIVSQVTGQPFEQYILGTLLPDLGIEDAQVMHAPSQVTPPSPFHIWQSGRYRAIDPTRFAAIHVPSGGLALTAEQMGRALQKLLQGGGVGGLTPRAVAAMQRPIWPHRPEFSGRTLGYWTEIWAGHRVYTHGGTHFGFHTNMVLVPSLDLAFFVAANGPSGGALMALPRRVLREVIAPGSRPRSAPVPCSVRCLEGYAAR